MSKPRVRRQPVRAKATADVGRVDAVLAQPGDNPPIFMATAADLGHVDAALEAGWDEVTARIERWAAAGYVGDWTDPEYDADFDGGAR